MKMINFIDTKASYHMVETYTKTQTDISLQCYVVEHDFNHSNKLTSLRKRRLILLKSTLQKMMENLTVQTIDRRLKNSSLISEMY
jgi:hypothetical protein